MFGFRKKNPTKETVISETDGIQENSLETQPLSSRLTKTRRGLTDKIADFVLGKKSLDQDLIDELETSLLAADVGLTATQSIIDTLQDSLERKAFSDNNTVRSTLSGIMLDLLRSSEQPLVIDASKKPFVVLVVGINGAGKTTSIGKLAHHYISQDKSVLLAAGDTFRAAAVEQLQEWGERNQIPVVSQGTGADPASVVYDAIQSAKAKDIDVVIADTAGRLHTQSNLMDELIKIKRVISKIDDTAPHETLLVLDASFGQNALQQAIQFDDALDLTGLAITKLDGTAKGGILFAIADKLKKPIRFIGVGEGIQDLRPFNANDFVEALLEE